MGTILDVIEKCLGMTATPVASGRRNIVRYSLFLRCSFLLRDRSLDGIESTRRRARSELVIYRL